MPDLSEFLSRLWDHAWWFLTNVVLVRQPLFALLPTNWQKRISKHRISVRVLAWKPRLLVIYTFAASGFIIASFLAFRDEYNALLHERPTRPTESIGNMTGKGNINTQGQEG